MISLLRPYRWLQVVAAVLVTVVVSGCGAPKLEPIADGGVILAFGDSLTVGVGADRTNSYPAVLADLTGLRVINSGVSGETTDRSLQRLPQELDRTAPDLLILVIGGNDILQNRSPSEIKINIKGMIELANSRSVPVVLIGIPRKAVFSDSAPLYEELAEHFKLVFDGTLIADLQRSPALKSDHVHLNDKGYRKMAESIYELLEKNGAFL